MELTCSSETSIDFRRTIWRYIPEDRILINNNICNCISNDRPNDSETPWCKNIHISESFHTSPASDLMILFQTVSLYVWLQTAPEYESNSYKYVTLVIWSCHERTSVTTRSSTHSYQHQWESMRKEESLRNDAFVSILRDAAVFGNRTTKKCL
jgi:hypothetical protein